MKAQIQEKEGTSPDLQELTWGGFRLKDEITLSDYHIQKKIHSLLSVEDGIILENVDW